MFSGRNDGIYISANCNSNTIQNNYLSQCSTAVYSDFDSSIGNRFLNNDCSGSGYGLSLYDPAEVSGNDLSNCSDGSLVIFGHSSSSPVALQDALTANIFTGSALALRLKYVANGTAISDLDFTGLGVTSALRVVNGEELSISNLTLPVTGTGLGLDGVTNSTISGTISLEPCLYGIFMSTCSGSVIENCMISGHTDGTYGTQIESSQNVTLTNVEITGTKTGLRLYGVTNSTVDGLTCIGPGNIGVVMYNPADNVIKNCTLSGRGTGIHISGSSNNQIYNSNIFGNSDRQVTIIDGSSNILNLSASERAGNYWGRSCPGPLFVVGVDASPADIMDNLPYATFNGWLGGGAPGCPPVVGPITGPIDPVMVNTEIDVNANFTNPDESDTHTAEWDWGDGNTSDRDVDETGGSGTVEGSHTYDTPGVYIITLTVTDNHGASGKAVSDYVVVYYDLSVGFVTGGGWIDSPAGAYAADPDLAGKANFGFVSRYKKGATTPSGQTEFNFSVADMNFHSDEYQWLVVAGSQAKFKGDGTINGLGNYGFMLSAVDAALTPSTDVDLFRIKIWDKDNGDSVVYDNGDADNTEATTEIGGGSIVIHEGGAAAAPALTRATVSEWHLDQNYPNPFNPETWIPYQLKEGADVTVTIYSTTGQLVRRLDLGYRNAGSYTSMEKAIHWDGTNEHGERVSSGLYFYTIQAGEFTATKKMIIAE